ncbi:MAG: hypothetical protein AUG51_19390 [Acidobacteria bacterium 13_1_20CM_3_53_8]|nr:MAG: hypothetical protein AUG51_19390 [Acidobacteria bacterium 13_1_20CM_3_53_8]
MTDEELKNKFELVADHLATLAVNQQKADERLARLESIVTRLAEAALNRLDNVDEKISALVDSQLKTDENIRNLTAVVDKYFSEGRNGQS